jgi:hypothetical protein
MIEMRRAQLSFGDGLIAEEVSDLREDWMQHADQVLAAAHDAGPAPASHQRQLGRAQQYVAWLSRMTGRPDRLIEPALTRLWRPPLYR